MNQPDEFKVGICECYKNKHILTDLSEGTRCRQAKAVNRAIHQLHWEPSCLECSASVLVALLIEQNLRSL